MTEVGGIHSVKELINNIINDNNKLTEKFEMYKVWPIICGAQLSAVTSLKGFKNNTLFVFVFSSSAKPLLLMKKNQIIDKYNEMFENAHVKDLKILKQEY